jgi:hypothetical protein
MSIKEFDGEPEREYTPVPMEDNEKKFDDALKFSPFFAGLIFAILFLINYVIIPIPGLGTSIAIFVFAYMGVREWKTRYKAKVGDIVHGLPRVYTTFNYHNGYEQCFSATGASIAEVPMEAIYISGCYGIVHAYKIPHDNAVATILDKESASREYPKLVPAEELKKLIAKIGTVNMANVNIYHVKVDHVSHFKHVAGQTTPVTTFHESIWITPRDWKTSISYRPRIVFGAGFNYKHSQVDSVELDYAEITLLGNVPVFKVTGCDFLREERSKPIEITRDQQIALALDSYAYFYTKAESRSWATKEKLLAARGQLDAMRGVNISKRVDAAILQNEAEQEADSEQYTSDQDAGQGKRRSYGWLCWLVIAVVIIIMLVKP